MNDEELRKYIREEFVNSGFIIVNQWTNFIDYLQSLLKSKEKEMLDIFNELVSENLYPSDIFPEVTKKQLSQIDNYLETRQGFPLDRLSAHISRLILKGIREALIQKLKGGEK